MTINIGSRIDRLTVTEILKDGYAICRCDCGNTKKIKIKNLTRSHSPTRSCGCLHKEAVSQNGKKTIWKNSEQQTLTNRFYNTNFQVIESSIPPKNNTSGTKGVIWNKTHQKWEAYISLHGQRRYLGNYDSLEEAKQARQTAEGKYFAPLINQKKAIGK